MADRADRLTVALTGHANEQDIVNSPQTVTLTLSGNTTGDSVIIHVDDDATSALAYNASASDVAAAINALDAIDPDNQVTATGGPLNTSPVVIHVPELDDITNVPVWTIDTSDLTGTGTITTTGGAVQASHDTTVVTDPTSQDAVQTPIAQQTGGLNSQGADSPEDVFGAI